MTIDVRMLTTVAVVWCALAPLSVRSTEMKIAPPEDREFAAQLVLTNDAEAFKILYAAGQKVWTSTQTTPQRQLKVMGLISGCTSDDKGMCHVTSTFRIYQSNGNLQLIRYGKSEGVRRPAFDVLTGPPPPETRWNVIDVGHTSHPVAGDYLIVATFTDRNIPNTELTAWQVLHVVESPEARQVRAEIRASGLSDVGGNPQLLNSLGYEAMYKSHEVSRALKYFRWNTILFPDQPDIIDSLAEGCLQAGDSAEAIKLYTLALTLKSKAYAYSYGNAAEAESILARLKADPAVIHTLQKELREAYDKAWN